MEPRARRQAGEAIVTAPHPLLRFYFDEHVRQSVLDGVRGHNLDVLSAFEAGQANKKISDEEQLAFATHLDRILVTNDTDFLNFKVVPQLLTGEHSGVIYIHQAASIGDQIRFLRYMAATETPTSFRGTIRFFEPIPVGIFPDEQGN